MDDMQKRLGIDAGKDSGPGWKHQKLGGRIRKAHPWQRRTNALRASLEFPNQRTGCFLGQPCRAQTPNRAEIPPQKYVFDSYQLEFTSEKGELRFAYPPEKKVNNLVGTVRIKAIRWRQYKAGNSYISVTFDRNGINGLFGGRVYRGETWGGFSFFFSAFPVGWLAVRQRRQPARTYRHYLAAKLSIIGSFGLPSANGCKEARHRPRAWGFSGDEARKNGDPQNR